VIDAEGACRLRNGKSGEAVDICPDEFRLDSGLEGVWSVKGLHEYLRFVKYPRGGFLAKHCDAMYEKSDDERSFFTFMLYLNGNLDGGSTRFLKIGHDAAINGSGPFEAAHGDEVVCTVNPEMGSCLIFFQPGLLHEGEELRSHEKYILRSDVMFQRIRSPKEAGAAHVAPFKVLYAPRLTEGTLCDRSLPSATRPWTGGSRLAARRAQAAVEDAQRVEVMQLR